MKYKKPLLNLRLLVASLVLSLVSVFAVPAMASAIVMTDCPDGSSVALQPGKTVTEVCKNHQAPQTSDNSNAADSSTIDALSQVCHTKTNCTKNTTDPATQCGTDSCDLVVKYVNPAIKLLSILVGLLVTISIIIGGIQYSTSAGDPQKAAKAKHRITMTIVALIAYTFLYAFLQFIIPGGIQ